MSKLKVLLAEDHRLLAAGFRLELQDHGIDVVDVSFSLDGLADKFTNLSPDVLVVDVRFDNETDPIATGLDVCEEILKKDPTAKILVFSQFDDQFIIEKTYDIGVLAFVLKDEPTNILINAIEAVSQGRMFFSPRVAEKLARSVVCNKSPQKVLDEKELRVFTLHADGSNIHEIADIMNFSNKTVGKFLASCKTKLDLNSQADFTKMALRYELTTLDRRK